MWQGRSSGMLFALITFYGLFSAANAQEHEIPYTDLLESESLYANLDIESTVSYKSLGNTSVPEGYLLVSDRTDTSKYVLQNGKQRLLFKSDSNAQGKSRAREINSAFDGNRSLSLETTSDGKEIGAVGNIHDGYKMPTENMLPHLLPLRDRKINVPFAIWLQGNDKIAAHGGLPDDRFNHTCTLEGVESVDGLDCVRVVCRFSRIDDEAGKPVGERHFLLAKERNYLPIKTMHFSTNVSKDLPTFICELKDLKELSPGVWFPLSATSVSYDKASIQNDGALKEKWREDIAITAASLKPDYSDEFFRDVHFPDGVSVYHFSQGGEQIESYIQGGQVPSNLTSAKSGGSRVKYLLIIANGLAVVLIAGWFIRYRMAPR